MNNNNNKWLSVILAFALCLPLYAFTSGDGTYENPYEIAGQSDIVNLIDMVATNDCSGLYFLQTADIDLSPFGNFQGIGSVSADLSTTNAFSGYYDGDGYILTNYYSSFDAASQLGTPDGTYCRGFFNILKNATIQNFSIFGFSTNRVGRSGSRIINAYIGGVAGAAVGSTLFENVENHIGIGAYSYNGRGANFCFIGGVCGLVSLKAALSHNGVKNYGGISLKMGGGSGNGFIGSGIYGYLTISASATSAFSEFENHGNLRLVSYGDNLHASSLAAFFYIRGGRPAFSLSNSRNYGALYAKGNAANLSLVFNSSSASSYNRYYNIANYGEIRDIVDVTYSLSTDVCGGIAGREYFIECFGVTNYAPINVSCSSYGSQICIAGATTCSGGGQTPKKEKLCNFGDISVECSDYPNLISVGGVVAAPADSSAEYQTINLLSNFGKISVRATSSSVRTSSKIGVAGCVAAGAVINNVSHHTFARNAMNFGDVSLSLGTNFVGRAVISGVLSRYSQQKGDVILTNSYNLGKISWSGKGIEVGGICGDSKTIVSSDEYVYLRNCYSVGKLEGEAEGNFVGSIIGCVSNVLGKVAVSNCFAISEFPAFGAFYGGSTNNNVASYIYEEAYHNPSITQGYLYNYAFTQANNTNEWADLTLPINKLIFPTITDEIRKKHTYTSVMGYKRYVKTNRR